MAGFLREVSPERRLGLFVSYSVVPSAPMQKELLVGLLHSCLWKEFNFEYKFDIGEMILYLSALLVGLLPRSAEGLSWRVGLTGSQ